MVCLACLLFLIPVVNFLFNFIAARVYRLLGWEYRKPVGAPPSCPIKPSAASRGSTDDSVAGKHELPDSVTSSNPLATDDDRKQD